VPITGLNLCDLKANESIDKPLLILRAMFIFEVLTNNKDFSESK